MSLRITALVYAVCFVALWVGLYLVKYSVQNIQRDVVAMRDNLGREKESLHLLNAEWAYLNRPDRLERLADRHLDLVPLDSKKIEDISVLPAASTIDATAPESREMIRPIHHVAEER